MLNRNQLLELQQLAVRTGEPVLIASLNEMTDSELYGVLIHLRNLTKEVMQ